MLNISNVLKFLYTNGGIFQFDAKLQVLDKNYNVLAEFTNEIIDGRITVNKDRTSIRDFDMTLVNMNNVFTWGPTNLIWLDKKFKLFIGIGVNGAWEWLPQGVFPCSNPLATSQPDKREVEFRGSDKMAYLGKCANVITVQTGTNIGTAIQSVLTGIETMFIFDSTTVTAPYDMTWDAGTEYQEIIAKLASIPTWDLFYDVNGYLRFRAPIDPNTTPPMLSFDATKTGFNLYAGGQRELDESNLANHIVVRGGSSQTALVFSELKDTSPSSPTSIQNIGDRLYLHNSGNPDPVITTQALADARANYEYKKRLQIIEKQHFNSFPIPFMEQEDVYSMNDPNNGTSGNYQVMNFTLPLKVGDQMTGEMWQVRSFV